MGEYCHDNSANGANRAPAGVCEWNLVDKPGFQGWPFCVGDNSPANTTFRWDYQANASTSLQYDCTKSELPADLRWAPDGQTGAAPTFDGLDTIPGPATAATVWKKYAGAAGGQSPLDFGNLEAGGMSPITGPVYRYDADTAGPGAFPPYYDGSWFIANRGADNGFWKEVRLRKENGKMLRVNDWAPSNQFGAPNNSFVIPTQFGPDGALYMARWTNGCCRTSLDSSTKTQLIKVEFGVQDECLEDTDPPNVNHALTGREHPTEPNTYFESATLTLTAGDAGCAGVKSVEYRVGGAGDWQPYTAPHVFSEPGTYSVEYRATDRFDNASEVKTATFSVVATNDHAAPVVTAALSGTQTEEGYYTSPATLDLEATDALSPIRSIEYRDNQEGDWTAAEFEGEELTAATRAELSAPGFHYVEFRATDDSGNTSEVEGISFSVVSACTYERSDEFDGSALDDRWLRHDRNGGTPAEGDMAPTVADGKLTLPTNDFELDAASATTSVGPVNFVGQDLAQLGDDWEVETQFTVTHTGGWQGVGLMLWQADNNFFRSTITHSLSGGNIYIEQSKDNPTTDEGARVQGGGNVNVLPAAGPVTIRMRYAREDGADTVKAQYRILAPASAATPDWVDFPWTAGGSALDLEPVAGKPRRDAPGSRVGIYAGGNFPGTAGEHPYTGTPASVEVDYFRVKPDTVVECPEEDVLPPDTTATLEPAEPGPGGTYNGPVGVRISATDPAGVAAIEYSVDDGSWQSVANEDEADPFAETVKVAHEGTHTVRYRARDTEGNLAAPQEVTFAIADVRDVFAEGDTWSPDALSVPFGDAVTWHFDEPAAGRPHDVWLVAPGTDPQTGITQVTKEPVFPGGPPVSFAFRKAGALDVRVPPALVVRHRERRVDRHDRHGRRRRGPRTGPRPRPGSRTAAGWSDAAAEPEPAAHQSEPAADRDGGAAQPDAEDQPAHVPPARPEADVVLRGGPARQGAGHAGPPRGTPARAAQEHDARVQGGSLRRGRPAVGAAQAVGEAHAQAAQGTPVADRHGEDHHGGGRDRHDRQPAARDQAQVAGGARAAIPPPGRPRNLRDRLAVVRSVRSDNDVRGPVRHEGADPITQAAPRERFACRGDRPRGPRDPAAPRRVVGASRASSASSPRRWDSIPAALPIRGRARCAPRCPRATSTCSCRCSSPRPSSSRAASPRSRRAAAPRCARPSSGSPPSTRTRCWPRPRPSTAARCRRPGSQVEARPERWLQAYARAIGSAGLAIEPVWRAARSLLERETERVGTAAVLGASRELLGMLHAHGRLAGDRLVLERGGTEPARWVLPGEGLVLVPMLAGRGALVSRHRGNEVTHLAYPVPGIDRLLDAPRSSRDALEGLLGPPRATILRMLDGRMIAGDLARSLAVVPSAVTHHLAALEGAGLILRERTGRHVMVSRTARGSALLALYELPR